MSTTIEKIQRQIAENPILLYMKGSPKLPSCLSTLTGRLSHSCGLTVSWLAAAIS